MSILWRGDLQTRLRIGSGLVLFAYALLHFLNLGAGLISPEAANGFQDFRQLITRSFPGTVLIYGSLLLHAGLAVGKLAAMRTLRLPFSTLFQSALGVIIPTQLIVHLVFTRYSHEIYATNDEVGYLSGLIWNTPDGWIQSLLLLVVWVHSCFGLHMWLRITSWWHRWVPVMAGLAVFVPAFALAGFATEGRRVSALMADPSLLPELQAAYNWPEFPAFLRMIEISTQTRDIYLALLGFAVAVFFIRRWLARRHSVRIKYVGGPEVSSPKGMTLLEISQSNGIPHTALCGGKGRCTTCRVIVEEGADRLPAPTASEANALAAVKAAPNARLACQVRPTDSSTVFRVFRPDGRRARAHASQGQERRLALLFLDMRGFTSRTQGQLPYDVVFLLNRFFDAIVPAITQAGGTVDKYLGDGLLAVFETQSEDQSARAALRAAYGVGEALNRFNAALEAEHSDPVRIGMGLHLGNIVLGEIGAAGKAPRTIIGDTVNAASRLEGCTKEMGVELLVSDTVLTSAGLDPSGLDLHALELRGVSHPVHALAVPRASAMPRALRDTFEAPKTA